MAEPISMTTAGGMILREIQERGPIPFARFMELALYAPGAGYYERRGREIGRGGDFYTSVSVGPAFGFLLSQRVARWMAGENSVELVEAAAHDGRLAVDILTALRSFEPALLERVRYTILEPSAVRRSVQEEALSAWAGRVRWVSRMEDQDPGSKVTGVILANELLDAYPVHRFVWDARMGCWWEAGVGLGAQAGPDAGRLVWCRLGTGRSGEPPPGWPEELLAVLPDGFVTERCPGARAWWERAAGWLARGWLLTADYGFEEGDAIRPERTGGTLRAYHKHRRVDDLLASPGEQDLTAHVDFQVIREVGERAGLSTVAFRPQGRWLGEVAVEVMARGGPAADWLVAHARQMQTLTHPVHLGQAMKVLVQRR